MVRPLRLLVGLLGVLPLTLPVACASSAGEDAAESDDAVGANAPHMLAIGDSITFAWNPLLESDNTKVDPRNYAGYAERIATKKGWKIDNASCPGEASGSFLRSDAKDNGCDANRADYALHHGWAGADTQAEFFDRYLRTQNHPELITMTLGGNDLLVLQKECQHGFLTGACELVRLPFFAHGYEENLEAIFDIADQAGYAGTFVVITTYASDYSDKVANLALSTFNGKLREAVREAAPKHPNMKLVVADAFGAFKAQAEPHGGKTCDAGLLVKKPDGSCDIHPSETGHELLAKTVLDAVAAAAAADR